MVDAAVPAGGLTVRLANFEGPLDLLLYLIQRDELSIYDIPIARITEQYLEYIADLAGVDLVRASDFLVMAATLLGIKARMLLPSPPPVTDEELPPEDPREELVRRLEAYAQVRTVAEHLKDLEARSGRVFARGSATEDRYPAPLTGVNLEDLMAALARVLATADQWREVPREEIPIWERIRELTDALKRWPQGVQFSALIDARKGRLHVVVTFLALLELMRLRRAEAVQEAPFAEILIRRVKARPRRQAAAVPTDDEGAGGVDGEGAGR